MRRRTLDEMVQRIVQQMLQVSTADPSRSDRRDTADHRDLAQQIAAEGIVLLKDDHDVLPLAASDLDSIAIIGPNADTAKVGGGGRQTEIRQHCDLLSGSSSSLQCRR